MLNLSCQMRMMGISLLTSHSMLGRVYSIRSVFTKINSLNRRHYVKTVLCKGAVPEKSPDWEPPQLQRLYEDDWVLAISKPGSLFVHNSKEASKEERERKAFLKDLVEEQHTQGRPLFTVHRLDRGASGVLLFAKSSLSAHAAQLALAHEDTVKEYLVLARGCTPDSFICDEPINDDKGISRSAWTKCDKLLDLPKSRSSLLKVCIKTGRWHQIRKHLNHRAHHVIGDGRHGKGQTNQYFRDNYHMPLGRCFLHAARLTIPHPSRFAALCINRNLPTGTFESHTKMEYETHSEHVGKGLSNFISKEAGIVLPLIPENSAGFQIECRPQVLNLRASLPTDLRRVLLALPDQLSCEFVDSLALIGLNGLPKQNLVYELTHAQESVDQGRIANTVMLLKGSIEIVRVLVLSIEQIHKATSEVWVSRYLVCSERTKIQFILRTISCVWKGQDVHKKNCLADFVGSAVMKPKLHLKQLHLFFGKTL